MALVDRPPRVDRVPPGSDASAGDGGGRLRFDLVTLVGAYVALIGAGIGAQRLSDNSFLTHLASGREMLEHGFVTEDRFTWTSAGESIVMQSWLASLLYGMIDAAAGLGGVRLLMAATAAGLAWVAWRLTAAAPSLGTRVVVIVPGLLIGLRTWSERPLLLGLLLFGIVMLAADRRPRPVGLAIVGGLWINLHGSWPLGLVYLIARAAGARIDEGPGGRDARHDLVTVRWLAVGMLVGGVVNPYGPALLSFPLELLGRNETLSLIAEWKSPSFDSLWTRAFLGLLLLAVVAVSRRSRWRTTLPMLLFVAAALLSRRNVPVATLVMLPVIAAGLPSLGLGDGRHRSDAIRAATVATLGLIVLLPALAIRAPHFDGSRFPEAALDAAEDLGLSPEDFRYVHQDFVGNYMGLRYRGPVAWIDDRFELHPVDLIDDYVVLLDASSGWHAVLERHRAEVLLWPTEAPLTELAERVAGWPVAYRDDEWTVLCHPDLPSC